jgi:hypothetical protein
MPMNDFIFKWIRKLRKTFLPRYTLTICERFYSEQNNSHYYKLLTYGETRPITVSSQEILNNQNLKKYLSPDDLLNIFEDFKQQEKKQSQFKIIEIARNGIYTLKNSSQYIVLNGVEFCNKPWLMSETNSIDVFKIISETYFKQGRNFEKNQSAYFSTAQKPSAIAMKPLYLVKKFQTT